MADPTSEERRRSKRAGDEFARQFREGRGVWYEKYRKGLHAYLKASFDTPDDDGDTITPNN